METLNEELYFDPFADDGEQLFDPTAAFAELEQRYTDGDVEHDYTADNFVRDTEALMMDAAFVERFEEAQAIAARMHELCGEDHMLNQAFQEVSESRGLFNSHEIHDGHNHQQSDDEYEIDPKTGKKVKKKKRRNWFKA